jgi:CRP-like cAMP-binding protein
LAEQYKKLTTIEKMIRLKSVDIFEQATVEQLARIAGLTEEVFLEPGVTIYQEGQTSDALYFLLSGRVTLEKNGTAIFDVKEGETFGTLAALDLQSHLYTARAAGPTHLFKLGVRDFHDLLSLDSGLVLAVLRVLCRLIRGGRFAMS